MNTYINKQATAAQSLQWMLVFSREFVVLVKHSTKLVRRCISDAMIQCLTQSGDSWDPAQTNLYPIVILTQGSSNPGLVSEEGMRTHLLPSRECDCVGGEKTMASEGRLTSIRQCHLHEPGNDRVGANGSKQMYHMCERLEARRQCICECAYHLTEWISELPLRCIIENLLVKIWTILAAYEWIILRIYLLAMRVCQHIAQLVSKTLISRAWIEEYPEHRRSVGRWTPWLHQWLYQMKYSGEQIDQSASQ